MSAVAADVVVVLDAGLVEELVKDHAAILRLVLVRSEPDEQVGDTPRDGQRLFECGWRARARAGGRPGIWPPKPATTDAVSTDSEAPAAALPEMSVPPNPATTLTVSTDPPPRPGRAPTASACEPYCELIDEGVRRGRNAMAIWQDLVVGTNRGDIEGLFTCGGLGRGEDS